MAERSHHATALSAGTPAAGVEKLSPLVDPDGSVQGLMPSLKLGFIGFV